MDNLDNNLKIHTCTQDTHTHTVKGYILAGSYAQYPTVLSRNSPTLSFEKKVQEPPPTY